MKTKPFDLRAALNGAPVVTADGKRVTGIRYKTYPICGTVVLNPGDQERLTFTLDGRMNIRSKTDLDLYMLDEEGGAR